MLVIERDTDEEFTISTSAVTITIRVLGAYRGKVSLGITAPKEWAISRDDMKKERK